MATDTAVLRYPPLEETLLSCRKSLSTILGTQEKAGQLMVEVLNMARRTPDLARCEPSSLTFAVIRIASLRLNPSLPNEVWLIPRRSKRDNVSIWEATLQYGYGGLRKLILRSPEVQDCFAREVRVNDTYEPPPTPVSLPVHILPAAFAPRGRVIGYYAAVQLTCGNWRTWMMSVAEVEAHRDRYVPTDRAGVYGSSWQRNREDQEGLTNFDKMGLKTVLRQVCNPRDFSLETEVAAAIAAEDGIRKETPAQLQGSTREGQRQDPSVAVGDRPLAEHVEDLYGPAPGHEARERQEASTSPPIQPSATTVHGEGTRGGQTVREAIEGLHRGAGQDECWIAHWWRQVCQKREVPTPEDLPVSTLTTLLSDLRRFYGGQQADAPQLGAYPEPGSDLAEEASHEPEDRDGR